MRNSCRLVRKEYDHEAEKIIGDHFYVDNSPLRSRSWLISTNEDKPPILTMADLATVILHPPGFVVNRMARFPKKLISWHWIWLKTVVVEFWMGYSSTTHQVTSDILDPELQQQDRCAYSDLPEEQHFIPRKDRFINTAVRMAFQQMDRMITNRTGTTVRRRTFTKEDRRPVKCEMDTFVLRWVDYPTLHTRGDVIVSPPAQALPSNHDRLWDISFKYADNGCFNEVIWRRRSQADAQRDAEDDFMPVSSWLYLE